MSSDRLWRRDVLSFRERPGYIICNSVKFKFYIPNTIHPDLPVKISEHAFMGERLPHESTIRCDAQHSVLS